jgi:hypothetical protein
MSRQPLRPQPSDEAFINLSKVGIGGWLILVAIQVIITPIWWGYTFYSLAFAPNKAVATATGMIRVGIRYEQIAALVIVAWSIGNILAFFGKRKDFPMLYRIFMAVIILHDGMVGWIYLQIANLPQGILTKVMVMITINVGLCVAWLWYFLVSQRVKNTFVH